MKPRKILLLLVLINLLLFVVSACSKEIVEENIEVYSYDTLDNEDLVVENDDLELHFNPTTTQFFVVNKKTGNKWYSNPQDIEEDVLAQGVAKKDLQATISIRYNTESGSPTVMNNYGSSIENGNYTYDVLENGKGIKVNYTIGNIDKVFYIPLAVPESRWAEFFDLIEKSKQSQILNSYKIYDINKLGKNDNKEQLLEKYPDLENERIFELRSETKPFMKQKIEDFFAEVGYTSEDFEKDAEKYSNETVSKKPVFNISMIYELDGDSLLVSIPMNEIAYRKDYPIIEIKPLAYFGAGGVNNNGFIIVPDGSGGLINFNNKKSSQSSYKSDLYGWDYGMNRKAVIDETRSNFPLFGISNGGESFICVLEDGSSYGFIEADVSGKIHGYNYAAVNYNLVRSEVMDISAKSDRTVRMFQEELPDEVITQRYIFNDKNDYTSMAVKYREYLLEKNPELVKKVDSEVPVAVELIGAVDRTKHVLGIPTRQPDALTTYKEAEAIIGELLDHGITNLSVKYNGWFNDGILHDAPSNVKLISELGSKKDFNNLVNFTNKNNVKLYLESTFQFVYNNSITDGFMAIRDSAKYVNRKLVELYPYHPVWYGEDQDRSMFHLAKPSYYLPNIDAYAKGIKKLGVNNIAFGDIGSILSADYNPKMPVSREEALKLQKAKMAELKNGGYNLMINTGNVYAVPYADFVVDMNLGTRGYNIIDDEVPFLQIALHGLVSYAGRPMNLAEDFETSLLKTVETGAGLYFVFMNADSFALVESNYTNFFSSHFEKWSDTTSELYSSMKDELGHIYNQFIVDHQKLAQGVFMTQYEDGTKVIVNYNESAYNHNGKEVPAKNYIVEGGKQ